MSAAGNLQIKPNAAPPAATTSRDPKVRTLKEPPEIWQLVHETRAEFKAGSALAGHLKAINPWGLALILLIIGGVTFFSFMTLRGRSVSPSAAPPAQAERGKTKTDLSPQPAQPNRSESSPAQSTDNAAPPTDTAASTIDEAKTNVAAPVASSETADIKIDEPKIGVAAPDASPVSRVLAKPPSSPTTAKGETVATRKRDRTQAATLVKVNTPTVARSDNKDVGKAAPAPALKSDKEKSANPPPAKKEPDKALSPQLIAPAKTSSTPKAKVIAWP